MRFRHNISRRAALRAARLTATTGAALTVLNACQPSDERVVPSEPVVVNSDEATVVTGENGDFSFVDVDFEPTVSVDLPRGNVIHAAEGTILPVMTAGSAATPMVVASALNLATGSLLPVVEKPVGDDTGNVVIYDAHCSDEAFAWVELDTLTRAWVLYASGLNASGLIGTPTTLWHGDIDWSPPRIAVSGKRVIWLVMPAPKGHKTTEHSIAYLWNVGDAAATAVADSPGRFATVPVISQGSVTLTPRVRADEGVFYGITAYTLDDSLGTIVDRLVMPQGVRPFYAARIGDAFAFSVEANYASGGLLGTMGTYFGVADGPFTHVPLEPYAEVCGNGLGIYIIKSRSSYIVIDVPNQRYAALGAVNRSVDYGEYPARVGSSTSFVTYATVKDADTGYPSTVTVRLFEMPNSLPEPESEPEE